MTIINGFVSPVPTANREAYLAHARACAPIFAEHGAISSVECWGDDVPRGEVTDFYRAVDARPDESIVFGWLTWPSAEALTAGMEAAMADPRLSPDVMPLPFDGRRMIWGGFEPLVELGERRPQGYFDGYLIPVPATSRERLITFARTYDAIFMEYGASWIVEGWGTHLPVGKVTDLHRAVQRKPDETVLFSWVQWPDKATRDAGSARMMEDPRFATMEMPFDGRRMVYGGFEALLAE